MADGPELFSEVVSRGVGGLFGGRLTPSMRMVQALGLSALFASGIAFGAAIYRRNASALHAGLIVALFTLALKLGWM